MPLRMFLLDAKHKITCSAKATTMEDEEEIKRKCGVQHEAWWLAGPGRGGGGRGWMRVLGGGVVFSGRSDDLLDAGSLEAAGTALLLDLTG